MLRCFPGGWPHPIHFIPLSPPAEYPTQTHDGAMHWPLLIPRESTLMLLRCWASSDRVGWVRFWGPIYMGNRHGTSPHVTYLVSGSKARLLPYRGGALSLGYKVVSQARPNQLQRGSLSVSRTGILKSIRAGVGWVWLVRLGYKADVMYVERTRDHPFTVIWRTQSGSYTLFLFTLV